MNRHFQSGRNFARRPSYRSTSSNFAPSPPGTGSGDQHIRSISNSSSSTLVSVLPEQKAHGPVIANGSYPYGGYGTPQNSRCLKDETSPSDEQSTPSPVAVRSAQESATPTRSASKASFQAIVPEAVPETPKPADPANLFVKNFDDDIISDPDDLKKLFEPYGPVASAHLAMIPGTNRSIGYGFVAFAKADDAANAKLKLNGSIVGKKRLFVSYAERKEERTQRLKLHFKKGKDGLPSDGKEPDPSNPEGVYTRSDNREEGSTEGTEKGEKVGSIEKEPPSPPLEKSSNRPEDGHDQDAIRESPEVSQIGEASEQGSSTTGALTINDRPPLTPVENVPPIVIEQDTTAGTGWRGRTQLAGSKFSGIEISLVSDNANDRIEVTEVEEEEVATETANSDNAAAYAKPTLPQIHDHVLDAVSGQVHESDFHDQIKEEMLQGESTRPDALGNFLRPNRSNSFHRQQHYDNRSPSPHNGNRHGLQYHNHGQNGTGRGYRSYTYQNPSYGRGSFRFYGNNRAGGNGGYHRSFSDPPSSGRTVFFNNSTQPFSMERDYETIGPQNQHRKKKWQGGNRNGRGGQQHRGSPANIDHHTVNNVMLDVNDTSQGVVTAY